MQDLPKEELYSRLAAINKSNAIIYFDIKGVILGVNDIFLKSMGYEKEEHVLLVGKHHSMFVCEDYAKSEETKNFINRRW